LSAKRTIGIVLAVGLAYIVIKGVINAPTKPTSSNGSTYTPSTPVTEYPESTETYNQVNADIGCKSTYSDQKKDDIFNEKYKNHWMTWKGEIALLESDEASLNLDGVGTQDLQVDFADKKAGYNLSKGSQLKVRFLMQTAGGCFLPFSGRDATVVR
jgi:hypothetical protein